MHEVDVLSQGHKIRFGDGINLRTIKLRPKNRKLVGADIDVLLVDAQQRLIAEAGTPRAFLVGCVDVVDHPGSGGIAGRIHRQVGARASTGTVDEEDAGEPGIGCFIKVATRVAGKLFQPLVKKYVDVERAGNYRAIGVVDREGRVDGLYDETVANTQTLVGRLKLSPEIRNGAVPAADAVEFRDQRFCLVSDG